MFLLGLTFGGTFHPWGSAIVVCLILFGVVTIVLFFGVERFFARYPIVPVHLYGNTSNLAVIVVNLFHGITFTQNTYFLPLYCQSVLDAEPLLSGVLLLPFAVAMSIATVGAGLYVKKTGRYLDCIRGGFALLLLGQGLMYDLPDGKTWAKIILYQVLPGLGVGLNFQPPLIALQNNVPGQDNAAATASFGLVRNVASAMGVVIGSVAFSNKMQEQHEQLVEALGTQTADLFSGSNAQANVLLVRTLPGPQKAAVRHAFWAAMRSIWIVAVGFSAAALVVCVLIRYKELGKTHVEVKTGLAGEEERRRIAVEQRARKQGASG